MLLKLNGLKNTIPTTQRAPKKWRCHRFGRSSYRTSGRFTLDSEADHIVAQRLGLAPKCPVHARPLRNSYSCIIRRRTGLSDSSPLLRDRWSRSRPRPYDAFLWRRARSKDSSRRRRPEASEARVRGTDGRVLPGGGGCGGAASLVGAWIALVARRQLDATSTAVPARREFHLLRAAEGRLPGHSCVSAWGWVICCTSFTAQPFSAQ